MESFSTLYVTVLAFFIFTVKDGQCQFGGMMGMGGMPGMGASMAIAGEIPPAEYMVLQNAVRQIVGPMASPTPAIIQIALRHGGIPTTLPQMMEYMPHFQLLAQQLNVRPPGVMGQPTALQLNNYIQQRANQWMSGNVPGFQSMNMMNPSAVLPVQPMISNPAPVQMRPVASLTLPPLLRGAANGTSQNSSVSQRTITAVVQQPLPPVNVVPIVRQPSFAMPAQPVQQSYMNQMPTYNTVGSSSNMMGDSGNMMTLMAFGGMMDLGFGFEGLV